jgi:hypothetical protein
LVKSSLHVILPIATRIATAIAGDDLESVNQIFPRATLAIGRVSLVAIPIVETGDGAARNEASFETWVSASIIDW